MTSFRRILLAVSLGAIACGSAAADIIYYDGYAVATTAAIPVTVPFGSNWNLIFPATTVPDNYYLELAYLEVDEAETGPYDEAFFSNNGPYARIDIQWFHEVDINSNADDQTLVGTKVQVGQGYSNLVLQGGFIDIPFRSSAIVGGAYVANGATSGAAYLAGDTINGTSSSGTASETCTSESTDPAQLPPTPCVEPDLFGYAPPPDTDTISGTLTFYFVQLPSSDTTTPEPATMVLSGSALASLALIRKRSRRQV